MLEFKNYEFKVPGEIVKTVDDAVRYTIDGKPLVHREFVLEGDKEIELDEYIVMEYSAKDFQRFFMLRQSVLLAITENDEGNEVEKGLICANEMMTDGLRHRVIAKCDKGKVKRLRLRMRSRLPHVELNIFKLYTCSYDELPERFDETEFKSEGYKTIDISSFTNDEFNYEPGAVDGGKGALTGTKGLLDIPFDFSGKILRPTPPPAENDDLITNINKEGVKRLLCRPESRESRFEIPVDDFAKEIYFVLYMDKKIHERWGFCAPDPTILGGSQGEVMMPIKINDIERYAVYINYEDGTVDECFPENLKNNRHEITGEVGVYGVRTNGKKIKSIGFEDRLIETDLSLE